MIRLLLRQLLVLVTSFIGITLLTFMLFYWAALTDNIAGSAENLSGIAKFVSEYWHYLLNLLHGDFGQSTVTQHAVLDEFLTFFPATLELASTAFLLSLLVGLPIGVLAAINKNRWVDHLVMSIVQLGYSMPIFWWGLLLILFFSLELSWTPVSGRISFAYDIEPVTGFTLIDTLISSQPYAFEAFKNALQHLILPSIVLSTIPMAVIARMTRSSMIEVLNADYIRTAKAKGASQFRVIWIHGLRNALIPVVTVMGLQASVLLTGAIITETIFSWPGIGKWILDAINKRDYATLQGGVLLISTLVIFINVGIDLLYNFINPKLRKPQ